MKCPHCLKIIHVSRQAVKVASDNKCIWSILQGTCPACHNAIMDLMGVPSGTFRVGEKPPKVEYMVYPKGAARHPLSDEVPVEFTEDYREACLVLKDSPKASAALSRRCLQSLLRGQAKVKKSDLSKEIEQVLEAGELPSYLADAIDAIRNLGNFAAHPIKSKNTGEIVEVEEGEAEWLLDVLEGLFDFYFVQPAVLREKREELNKKLKDAGKPEMK